MILMQSSPFSSSSGATSTTRLTRRCPGEVAVLIGGYLVRDEPTGSPML